MEYPHKNNYFLTNFMRIPHEQGAIGYTSSDARPILSQHQVRMPRQPPVIQTIPKSPLPQPTPHNHLRLRILRPDRLHIGVSLLWREFVHNQYCMGIIIRFSSSIDHCTCHIFPSFWSSRMKLYIFLV